MDDDEINQMIEHINDGGIRETQIPRILELLGAAEELSAELEATLIPSQRRNVRNEISAAMLKVFRWGL
jgi:hypothetical protein